MTTNKVITPTRGTDVARRLLGNAPAANYSSMDDYQQQVDSLEQEKTRPRVYNADKTEVPLLERIKTAYNDLEEYATRDGNDWITRARDEPLYIRGGANPYGSIMGHFNNSEPAETNNNTARYFTDLANRAANALTEKGAEVDKTSAVSSIWQQVKDRPALDYITLGYNEPFRLTEALKVVTKSDNGEELNKSEQQVLDAFHLFIDAEQMVEDEGGYSNSAVAGQGLAQVTDFVTQMGLSSALGKAAAKGASKGAMWFAKKAGIKVAKEAAQETAETAAKRFSLAAAKQTAIKAAKQLPSNIVETAAQTPLMSGAYTNYANRTLQQYDIADFDGDGTVTAKMARSTSEAERVYKSYISGFTEVFTEKLGNIMQPLKMLDLPAFSTMGAWFARANKFMGGNLPAVQQIRQAMSKYVSFNDFRYELGEEYINNTIEPLLTGEPERLAENWSPKSVLQTFYSTAAVCGAMNIATRTPGIVYDRYMSNDYKKKAASYLGNIENVEFRQELANAMARPTPAEQVEAIQKLDIMSVEPSDRTMALDYVEAQINRDLYRGVDQENGIKEKLDKSKQFFAEYHNPHTQSIELAQNSNGEEFAIMSNILEPTADGSVFVKNINTGQVSQTTMSELSNHQSMGGREYLTNIFDSAQSEATQATEQQTQTELVEQAQGAGLNAHQVIASNKGIDLDALEDRQVTLADGSTVQVKGVVRQGATTRIIASGINEQGDEVDTDVNVADIVAIDGKPVGSNTSQSSSQEQAPEPAGNNVATMPDEAAAQEIPLQKDGTPDYDAMSAQMFFDEYSKVTAKEEVEQELLNRLDNITSQMSKLESSKTTSVNEKVKNRDKIEQLKKKAVEISQVINSLQPNNTVPENEGIAAKPTYEFVVREITKLNKLSGANAVVFSDTNDLPDSIRKHMNGEAYLYDGVTMNEDSYIFAPSMQNADMIRSVYNHEVAAHRNIFVALGSDKRSEAALYCSIVDNIGISEMSNLIGDTEFSGYVNEYFNNPTTRNKIILGKEFVGYYAQQNFNDSEYQTIGSGEFIVNLSDDISLSDIDKILSTANNKGDDQRIFIKDSRDGNGEHDYVSNEHRDMGQAGPGGDAYGAGGESDISLAFKDSIRRIRGTTKNPAFVQNHERRPDKSISNSGAEISGTEQAGINSVEQAESGNSLNTGEHEGTGTAGTAAGARGARIGENNTLVSADRIEELRKRAKEKLAQLNSGFDPELFATLTELSVGYVEAGVRKFSNFASSMIGEFGQVIKPYLASMYEGAKRFPGMEQIRMEMDDTPYVDTFDYTTLNDINNVRDITTNLQSSSEESENRASDNEATTVGQKRTRERDNRRNIPQDAGNATEESNEQARIGHNGLGDNLSDQQTNGRSGVLKSVSSGRNDGGGSHDNDAGVANTTRTATYDDSRNQKIDSDTLKEKSVESILKDVPCLQKEQAEDVYKAEKRFAQHNGILFTNGTGTGKTFSGLGVVSRFAKLGNNNSIIVVPNDKIANDWVKTAKDYFNIPITKLESIKDAGQGVVVTTYANFRQNNAIVDRRFDLVIYDESHHLNQSESGNETISLTKHKQVIPTVAKAMSQATLEIVGPKPQAPHDKLTESQAATLDNAKNTWKARVKESKAQITDRAKQIYNSGTKVVMLSATPFAYIKNIIYGDGLLFSVNESFDNLEPDGHTGYNQGSRFDKFMMENFGYRMRNNKLTKPESNAALSINERLFYEKLKKEGAVSGRQLKVPFDYERIFTVVKSGVGSKIDEGISKIHSDKRLHILESILNKKWGFVKKSQFLEAAKSAGVVNHIDSLLESGKKVVIYHNFIKENTENPLVFNKISHSSGNTFSEREEKRYVQLNDNIDSLSEAEISELLTLETRKSEYDIYKEVRDHLEKYNAAVEVWNAEYAEYSNLDFAGIESPINTLTKRYGDRIKLFNGTVSKKDRILNSDLFNDDHSGVDIILVQRQAGKEGISFHDKTGVKQRVLINLGLPTAPTDAIQIEGRIYRTGLRSDAVFEYPILNTSFEQNAFAEKVATRSRTAENLAMGNKARRLDIAFKDGYLNAVDINDVDINNIGKGSKEYDEQGEALSPFREAVAIFQTVQKNNKNRQNREGIDYYATAEPVGFKMVELLHAKDNDQILEPSAGHGAIARFIPENMRTIAIEPSFELASKLRMNSNAEVINSTFEDLYSGRKFDGIVMNPPFGVGGKMAIEHLEKAYNHLRDGGRLVAIIPNGESTNNKLSDFLYKQNESGKLKYPDANFTADITLPAVAFKNAGTSIGTHIVIIDKGTKQSYNKQIDLSNIKTLDKLFDAIEFMDVAREATDSFVEGAADIKNDQTTITDSTDGNLISAPSVIRHTKTGEDLYKSEITKRVSTDLYRQLNTVANSNNGYYSTYAKGFLFKSESDALKFKEQANNQVVPQQGVRYRGLEVRDDINALFNKDLRKLIAGNLPRGYIMKLGMPSDALRAAGVPELPIELSAARLKEKSKQENHPFDLGSVINLPAAIANPIAVFDSKTQQDSRVILTALSDEHKNFVVAIKATNKLVSGRQTLEVNEIKSLYPKNVNQILYWIEQGDLLRWIDKEKAINWLGKQQFNSADVAMPNNSLYADTLSFISVQWPNYIGNGDKNIGLDSATKVIKNFKNPTIETLYRDNGNSGNNSISTEQQKQQALGVLSKAFNTPVQVVRSLDELPNDSKKRRAKGFYIPSTGQVTIVLPNNNTIADVQATFLHEVVAHKGMADLVGRENAEHFYDTIYGMLGEREKSLMDPTLTKSVAVEELFGKIAEGGVSPGMMRRVLAYVREFFRSLGIDLKISDNDIRYMLWRSANNLRTAKTASGIIELSAKNQAVIEELGVERDVVTALGQPTTVNELMERIAKVGPRKFTQEELEREMVAIKTESITEGTFMQGPNGEATNLTERQWLQVRTRAFINWFGDWQKVYRIEKLKNSTPVEITGKEITPSDDLKEYRKNALEFGKTLRGEYINKDTGEIVLLSGGSKSGGLREILHHDYKDVEHLQSIAAIPSIIERSIFIAEELNEDIYKHPNVSSYKYYICGLKIGEVDYTVKAIVAVDVNGNSYYDHKLTQIEKGALISGLPVIQKTGPNVNTPNLGFTPKAGSDDPNPSYTQYKDKRLLSVLQTNSSRVLDANFEPLVVYHGTNADFNIFDTDRGQDRASFFTDNLDMAAQFAGANGVVMPLFLNIKNPMISDAAGRVYGYKANSKMFDMDGAVSDARDKNHDGGVVLRIGNSVDLFNNEPIVGAQYYLFESSQIKSATGNNGEFNPENEDIRYSTVDKAIIGAKNKITYSKISKKLVDQTIAIKKFQELITKLGGVVDIDSDAHSSMYRRDSRIAAAARKYNIRYIEPLMEVVTTIAKEYLISKHDTEVYMLAKHSLERFNVSGIRTFSDDLGDDWTYDKVVQTISDFENKVPKEIVDELWDKTNKATNAILKMLHVSGLMTTAEYNFIMARGWAHYVPLRGWDFEAAGTVDPNEAFDYRQNSNKGISAEAAKKAKGRKTLAADPMANIWHIALSTIGKIESNEVNKHALKLARDNKGLIDRFSIITSWYHKGSDGKWSLMAEPPTKEQIDAVAATKREIRTLTDELKKLRDQNPTRSQEIVGQIDALRETIEFSNRSKTPHISPFLDKQIEQSTIRVIENGVEYWVLLPDPELANVLRGPKPDDRTWIKVAGATTRYMSSVLTAKNPEFIARNFVRDVQQAAKYHIVDKDGNVKGFMKYLGLTSIEGANQQSLFGSISGISIMRNLIGKADELTFNELGNLDISDPSQREILIAQYGIKRVYDTLYGMFLSGGGETGYAHLDSIKEIDRKLTRRITEGDLAKKWNALGIGLNNFAVLSENSTRFATFLAILDTGKGEKFAINYAKNATVNFNVKGEWAKTLGALYAFFNARVQGTAAQVRLAKNNPARYAASSMILAAAGYTLCKMIDLTGWIDDDDDILEYDRMNNICVPLLTTGKVIKIPLLQGARAYYGLGVLTYMLEHDRISVKEFAEKSFAALFDNASPFELPASWDQKQLLRIVMPTTSLPIYDVLSNSTYFGGTVNLESYFTKGIPDSELYKNGTLDFLKVATSWLNEVGGGNKNTPAGMNADGSTNTFQNWLDISPSTVQHVVAGYTGGVGKFVQNVLLMVNSWLPGGEKLESKNIPIFNAFYGDVRPRSYDSEFWELKSNIETLKAVNGKNIKDGTVPGYNKNMTLQQLANQQAKLAKQAKVMKQTAKQVTDILQQIEELPNGDPAKEQLTRQKQQLMKTAIQQYKNDTRN